MQYTTGTLVLNQYNEILLGKKTSGEKYWTNVGQDTIAGHDDPFALALVKFKEQTFNLFPCTPLHRSSGFTSDIKMCRIHAVRVNIEDPLKTLTQLNNAASMYIELYLQTNDFLYEKLTHYDDFCWISRDLLTKLCSTYSEGRDGASQAVLYNGGVLCPDFCTLFNLLNSAL